MIVALDYDNTFTLNPKVWKKVANLLDEAGIEIVCVTSRPYTEENHLELLLAMPDCVSMVFAGDEAKDKAAQSAGYQVDVWIDDKPELIKNPFVRSERISRCSSRCRR